jgi:hypothetical protein
MYGIERNGLNEKPKSADKAYCAAIQDKEEKLVATMCGNYEVNLH